MTENIIRVSPFVSKSAIDLHVDSIAELPTAGEADGQIRYVRSESAHYYWNAGLDAWHPIDASISGVYTDEKAMDAVGTALIDTATIELVYDDGNNTFAANYIQQSTEALSGVSIYVAGTAAVTGLGTFGSVVVTGNTAVSGNASVATIHVNGAATITGLTTAASIILTGNESVSGNVLVGGNETISGALKSASLVVNGAASITGNVTANRLFVSGETWADLQMEISILGSGPNAPDVIAHPGFPVASVYGFDGGSTMEEVFGAVELPSNYKEGTTIYPNVSWSPTTAGAGSVVWQMDYAYANNNATFITGTISGSQAASGIALHESLDIDGGISITGLQIGALFSFRLYRVPNIALDTYAADAALLDLDLLYQIDGIGSTARGVK